jgi:ribosome-associated translation inhibitor RaiA
MPSDHNHTKLFKLEHDLLAALQANNTDGLNKFSTEYSQVVLDVENAVSSSLMPQDEAIAHLCLSHNLYIASTQAQEVQLAVDKICDNFARQLNLVAPLTAKAPTAPFPPPPKEPVVEDKSSSSTSHSILKNWSHR